MEYIQSIIDRADFNQDKSIREVVYKLLKDCIFDEIIPLGEKIVEKNLADKLNISRTPVRDALNRLKEEELIEYIDGKGYMVKRITLQEVEEIYTIRLTLEVLAAKKAMESITNKEIEEIKDLLELTDKANYEGKVEEVIELVSLFNEKIYDCSRMKRLASMISKLKDYYKRFRDISLEGVERRNQALREHKEILRAIEMKDYDHIEEIIENHLRFSYELVISSISNESYNNKQRFSKEN